MLVTPAQICREWGIQFTTNRPPCFVRCNAKGEINWEKTLVYDKKQLVGRKINILNDTKHCTLATMVTNANEIKGIYGVVYDRAEDLMQFAFDIAQQVNTSQATRLGTEKAVGKKIADVCYKEFPNVKITDSYETYKK